MRRARHRRLAALALATMLGAVVPRAAVVVHHHAHDDAGHAHADLVGDAPACHPRAADRDPAPALEPPDGPPDHAHVQPPFQRAATPAAAAPVARVVAPGPGVPAAVAAPLLPAARPRSRGPPLATR